MSSTYTYAKVLKNVPALVGYLQEKMDDVVLDYYDYDATTTVLTLKFSSPLSVDEEGLLTGYVTSHVDRATLTKTDLSTFRYVRAYKTAPQTLSTTLNSSADVVFLSSNHMDQDYYALSSDGKYINILKPGTYLFMAKVSATLAPNATSTSPSTLDRKSVV